MSLDIVRQHNDATEIRAARNPEDGIGVLNGHFSAFNNWYPIESRWEGQFLERVAPGAFALTIAQDRSGMRVLFDHGFDPTIGNKVLGTIRNVHEDTHGAAFEVPLFDTTYNRDLLPGLMAGQYGASMRMQVMDDQWDKSPIRSDYNPEGWPERTISRAKVLEFGPVTFEANPAAKVGIRSGTDVYYDRLKDKDSRAYAAAVRSVGRNPLLIEQGSGVPSNDPDELVSHAPTSRAARNAELEKRDRLFRMLKPLP